MPETQNKSYAHALPWALNIHSLRFLKIPSFPKARIKANALCYLYLISVLSHSILFTKVKNLSGDF